MGAIAEAIASPRASATARFRAGTTTRFLAALLTAAAFAYALPAIAVGATITVNSTSDELMDDGHCSLREAITAANADAAPQPGPGECPAGSGTDTIVLPAGTYVLSIPGAGEEHNKSGDLDITGPTILAGAGAAVTTIDANHIDRAIHVGMGATATIEGVTITGGLAPSGSTGTSHTGMTDGDATGDPGGPGASGGGILSEGTLAIVDSVITRNAAGAGGIGGSGTGGPGSSGQDGAHGADGVGGDGGPGGSGGGVFSGGIALSLTRTIVSDNAAGAGGRGGSGAGGEGGFALTGIAGDGGLGQAGNGGTGGGGGGVGQRGGGSVMVELSSISGNSAGAGGPGGLGTGGIGGGSSGDAGGAGGEGLGGSGGLGGDGGGIRATGAITATDDAINGNTAGDGGPAGDGPGEIGGTDSGSTGLAGRGGLGKGGIGGGGGQAGGIEAGSIGAVDDTIDANTSGSGAAGGSGTGGPGGTSLSSRSNGSGGNGSGGMGGAGGPAGGLRLLNAASTLSHVTIASNSVGDGGQGGEGQGGKAGMGGTVGVDGSGSMGGPGATGAIGAVVSVPRTTVQNTIVAGNSIPSCDGTFLDGGHDIAFPDAACPGANVDPRLGPLGDNGGRTETRALEAGSPAIDAVPATGAGCTATDQRGVGRPQGGACDIGAYEHAPPGVLTAAPAAISATGATLDGQLNPNAQSSGYHFEYGTTTDYGSWTAPQTAIPGVAPTLVSALVSGLAPATTYHYRLVASNADGTSIGADQTFATTAAGSAGAGFGPRFLSASVRPRVFAVQRRGAAGRSGRRHPLAGTTFTYSLSERAHVVFTIAQILPGRRVGRMCLAPTRRNRTSRACARLGKARGFAVDAVAGPNITRFTGRIGGRALTPGRYQVTLLATDAAGRRSSAKRLTFRVVLG
jgi:CSLREA domain-containing protein